ncbi:MAG: phage integrase N-terminal SAM-like domain-containing protein [Planctomycetes bacterium]|nr:phage integrase N-terminal SAM-like domain-containing protein [Planctomycetota bacterium]
MSIRTEEAYLRWIEEFLRFHRDKSGKWIHPGEMGSLEINEYLTVSDIPGSPPPCRGQHPEPGVLGFIVLIRQSPGNPDSSRCCPCAAARTIAGGWLWSVALDRPQCHFQNWGSKIRPQPTNAAHTRSVGRSCDSHRGAVLSDTVVTVIDREKTFLQEAAEETEKLMARKGIARAGMMAHRCHLCRVLFVAR